MNSKTLYNLLYECANEKEIDTSVFNDIFTNSLVTVLKSKYGEDSEKYFDVIIDSDNQEVLVLQYKDIVKDNDPSANDYNKIKLTDALKIEYDFSVGETCSVPFNFDEFNRDDVLLLRTNIESRIKKTKNNALYEKYEALKNNVVNVKVYQFCRGHILLRDDKNNELILPYKETITHEKFKKGQFVKALVKEIHLRREGVIIILSRVVPLFLSKLLEYEITEITDGLILIKDVVRIAGVKSKVIVESLDINIDAISTCVGVRGNIINAISKELSGEFIDFVQYSDNFNVYLSRLFGIPEIKKIKYLENGIFVYVDPEYIGLVIGKDGSNIKLVRMLLNKHIDVFKYSDILDSNNISPVESLVGQIDDWVIREIKEGGFDTLEDILNISKEDFEKKVDLEVETIDDIYNCAKKIVDSRKS